MRLGKSHQPLSSDHSSPRGYRGSRQFGAGHVSCVRRPFVASLLAALLITTAASACGSRSTSSRALLGDYDGDGKADLAVFRPPETNWYILPIGRDAAAAAPATRFGEKGDIPMPGDYDGDRKNDLAVYRAAASSWIVLTSGSKKQTTYRIGSSSDVAVPGDYDGDGKTDIAVFAPDGVWSMLTSASNYAQQQTVRLGNPGDIAAPADYNGDGRTDAAVFRPQTATWHLSTWWVPSPTFFGSKFGLPEDIPVPGDYDGDGRADLAVFRPSNARWYIAEANRWTLPEWKYEFQFGLVGDIPVPGDYDGDGRTDIAVFRPPSGTWYILKSGSRFKDSMNVQWGLAGDIPILR